VIICEPKKDGFTVAGSEYRVGDKVNKGVLYIPNTKFGVDSYCADDQGILNKIIKNSDNKMSIKVVNSYYSPLQIGQTPDALTTYDCGQSVTLASTGMLYVYDQSKNLSLVYNLTDLMNTNPGLATIVISYDITYTTYKNCAKENVPQDLSHLYVDFSGGMFRGGVKKVGRVPWQNALAELILIIIGVVLIVLILAVGGYLFYRIVKH